ncbi:TPA: hypothetical protein R1951_002472 [Staphylococcus delphini]|nr:hypothetical protein [Staphylococcus delphini]HEC2222274.1 hypothetical protein [Staphylococcus delphini]
MSNILSEVIKIIIVYIAFLSVISALLKVLSFSYFVTNAQKITKFKLNELFLKFAGIIFILVELLIPTIFLIKGELYPTLIFCFIIIYIVATLFVLPSVIKRDEIECGCYGTFFKTRANWGKLLENTVYIGFLTMSFFLINSNVDTYIYLIALFIVLVRIYLLKKGSESL